MIERRFIPLWITLCPGSTVYSVVWEFRCLLCVLQYHRRFDWILLWGDILLRRSLGHVLFVLFCWVSKVVVFGVPLWLPPLWNRRWSCGSHGSQLLDLSFSLRIPSKEKMNAFSLIIYFGMKPIGKKSINKIKTSITKNLVKKLKKVDALTTSDFFKSDSWKMWIPNVSEINDKLA